MSGARRPRRYCRSTSSYQKLRLPLSPQLEHLERRVLFSISPSLETDKPDYVPSETAIISGSNFQLGETVQLQVLHTDGTPNTGGGHAPFSVVDGGAGDLDGQVDGNFQTTWFVDPDDSLSSTFVV